MTNRFGFIKSSIIGGVIFIIPLGMLLIVIGKVVPVVKEIDKSLMDLFPDDSILGEVAMHLIALVIVLTLCSLAGLFAQSAAGRRFMNGLEEAVLGAFPRFNFFKGFTTSLRESDEIAASFKPVIVKLDDYSQMAFEIERIASLNKVAVYLPGAPNPWSGTVGYVDPDRVEPLDMSVAEVVRIIKKLGKGTAGTRDATGGES